MRSQAAHEVRELLEALVVERQGRAQPLAERDRARNGEVLVGVTGAGAETDVELRLGYREHREQRDQKPKASSSSCHGAGRLGYTSFPMSTGGSGPSCCRVPMRRGQRPEVGIA